MLFGLGGYFVLTAIPQFSTLAVGQRADRARRLSSAQEVQERLEQVLEERKKLHAAWQQRKIYLDQLIDYHFFLRDAKNLDSASGQQEVSSRLGTRRARELGAPRLNLRRSSLRRGLVVGLKLKLKLKLK